MTDSCSCSNEIERAFLRGALAVLPQIDEEEKKEKIEETKKIVGWPIDCAALAVRCMSCSDEGN